MNLASFYRVSAAVLVLMVLASLWGLAQVGPDATVPIHWNVRGEPDGYASALVSFATVPLIAVGLVTLLAVVPRIEPRRANLSRSAGAYRAVAISLVLLMALIHAGTVLAGTGHPVPMATLMGAGTGLMFAVMGNVLTTVRSNFLFGVRTPWTLSSDLAWDRTHRLVGRLFVVAGIAMVLIALTGEALLVFGVMLAFIVSVLVLAIVYSYGVWKTDPDRRSIGSAP